MMLHHRLRMLGNRKTLSYVSAGTISTGESPTVDIPTADLRANDLLVLCVSSEGTSTTTPSGWEAVVNLGRTAAKIYTFYKIASGSETDFTLGNTNVRTQCGVVQYRASGGTPSYVTAAIDAGNSADATTATQTISDLPALIISHFCKAKNQTYNIGTVAGTNDRLLGGITSYPALKVVDEFPAATGTSTARAESGLYTANWATTALLFTVV